MTKHNSSGAKQKKTFSLLGLANFGFSGWAIVFLVCVILVFLGSILMTPRKVVRMEQPLTTVTVQVLNGCGDGGAADALARAMLPGDGSMLYDIIEKGDARLAAFEKTTVVDRRGSPSRDGTVSTESKRIAERLGIAEKDVILLRLEENILDIDVTVIAGKDYMSHIEKLKKAIHTNP